MILPVAARFPMTPKNAIVIVTQVNVISKFVSLYVRWRVSLLEDELLSNPLSPMLLVAARELC